MSIRMRRFWKNPSGRAVLGGGMALLLAGATLLFLYLRLPHEATFLSAHPHERKVAVELTRFRQIRQPFTAGRDGLSGLSLKLWVPGGNTGGLRSQLQFTLEDEHGSPVERQMIPVAALHSYGTYTVSFPPLEDSAGRRYTLCLTPAQTVADEKLLFFVGSGDGELSFGNAPAGSALVVDGVYHTTRIGSLYNGRRPPACVTLLIALCVASVCWLSALSVFLFDRFWFLPDGESGDAADLPPSGKE